MARADHLPVIGRRAPWMCDHAWRLHLLNGAADLVYPDNLRALCSSPGAALAFVLYPSGGVIPNA